MSRLPQIEERLRQINSAAFQELCERFLALQNPSYRMFARYGSQVGKQQTITGTPDAFLELPNGKYIFLEVTTQQEGLINKLKEDVNKCLDENKTGISPAAIQEIIFCCTSNFSTKQNEKIRKFRSEVNEAGVDGFTIYTLNSLAHELDQQHRNLVREYLGLALDTGQLVSLEKFMTSYQSRSNSLATPLDNPFKFRESKVEELQNALTRCDIVVLRGPAGVGKTKLAIEGTQNFLKREYHFNAYAIWDMEASLLEDLTVYFDNRLNNLLFVDDANRLDNLKQVIAYLQTQPIGSFKLILTVRDYAYEEVMQHLRHLKHHTIEINLLNDEQIRSIIQSEPFFIRDTDYHSKIISIAKGNPRIAIMITRLALDKQDIRVLNNLGEVFDLYFNTFVVDQELLQDQDIIKVAGLISFFQTLPCYQPEIMEKVLTPFLGDAEVFLSGVKLLEKFELAQSQYGYFRVGEQNLSSYFFYRAFIKDKVLSFYTLLQYYFPKFQYRFRDVVVDVNNTYGQVNVEKVLKVDLKRMWSEIKGEKEALMFLETFWFYLHDETLTFVYEKALSLPGKNLSGYISQVTESSSDDRLSDPFLTLLSNFFSYSKFLAEALDLSFEYLRKRPEEFQPLMNEIKGALSYQREDQWSEFQRQKIFHKRVIDRARDEDYLYEQAYLSLVSSFLKQEYTNPIGQGGGKVLIQTYRIQADETLLKLRHNIWEILDFLFPKYTEECFNILIHYYRVVRSLPKEIFEFDIEQLAPIMKQNLSPRSFKHCFLVKELIRETGRKSVAKSEIKELSNLFNSLPYQYFTIMDFNRYRNRDENKFEWKVFARLKEQEIRESLCFATVEDAHLFIEGFRKIHINRDLTHSQGNSGKALNYIVDENISQHPEIGFRILQWILEDDDLKLINFWYSFDNVIRRGKGEKNLLYDLIFSNSKAQVPELWKLHYLYCLPEKEISQVDLSNLYNTLNAFSKSTSPVYIYFSELEKFLELDENAFSEIILTINQKVDTGVKFELQSNFFSTYSQHIQDKELLQEAYLRQEFNSNFDYDGSELLILLRKDQSFLMKFLKAVVETDRISSREFEKLSILWQLEGGAQVIYEVFDYLSSIDSKWYFSGDIFNSFFSKNLQEPESGKRADECLLQLIESHSKESAKMDLVFSVILESRQHLFDEAFIRYLELNPEVEAFQKIHWMKSQVLYNGDLNVSSYRASNWMKLLEKINQANLGLKVIPIKSFIQKNTSYYEMLAEKERMQQFIGARGSLFDSL